MEVDNESLKCCTPGCDKFRYGVSMHCWLHDPGIGILNPNVRLEYVRRKDDKPRGSIRNIEDAVNPDHYKKGKVECIDALESIAEGLTGPEALLTCTAVKYLWRWKAKNGLEDLEKAKWYLDRLISAQG
jgi:hypothetical protein